MARIVVTNEEHEMLKLFRDGEVAKGWSDPTIDGLARRGLLTRMERVDIHLERSPALGHKPTIVQMQANEKIMTQRSAKHHYRISQRGLKALWSPRIISF